MSSETGSTLPGPAIKAGAACAGAGVGFDARERMERKPTVIATVNRVVTMSMAGLFFIRSLQLSFLSSLQDSVHFLPTQGLRPGLTYSAPPELVRYSPTRTTRSYGLQFMRVVPHSTLSPGSAIQWERRFALALR